MRISNMQVNHLKNPLGYRFDGLHDGRHEFQMRLFIVGEHWRLFGYRAHIAHKPATVRRVADCQRYRFQCRKHLHAIAVKKRTVPDNDFFHDKSSIKLDGLVFILPKTRPL